MSKAILMSIKPEWLKLILDKKKTIEIRKTVPKCELPIDVYLYCKKNGRINTYDTPRYAKLDMSGKVVAKFTLKKVERITQNAQYKSDKFTYPNNLSKHQKDILKQACLTEQEFCSYVGDGKIQVGGLYPIINALGNAYALYIEDLVVFDEPKELGEFRIEPKDPNDKGFLGVPVTKAPQIWQYLDVI